MTLPDIPATGFIRSILPLVPTGHYPTEPQQWSKPDRADDDGHFAVLRHENYDGRAKIVCRLCPFAETYVKDDPVAIAEAMDAHDEDAKH